MKKQILALSMCLALTTASVMANVVNPAMLKQANVSPNAKTIPVQALMSGSAKPA